MPVVPRIVRAAPRGAITTSELGIPVFATIRWYTGEVARIAALAVAWTAEAVEIQWDAPEFGMRRDWVPAADITRPDARGTLEPDLPGSPAGTPEPPVPPRNRPSNRKRQW